MYDGSNSQEVEAAMWRVVASVVADVEPRKVYALWEQRKANMREVLRLDSGPLNKLPRAGVRKKLARVSVVK